MSSALAIASVTAVLKNLLDNRLIEQGVAASVGDVTVTALPPDRITTGADERSQLNLFLYRITPNTGWRRSPLTLGNGHQARNGSNGSDGEAKVEPPVPLALDLHYLLTAYGEQDFQAEILLGYAMQLLHEVSALTPEHIRSALAGPNGSGGSLPPTRAALAASPLADLVEQVTIIPEFTNSEEMSRLWSALQARYRPSATYKVSAVLLEGRPVAAQVREAPPERPAAPATPSASTRSSSRGARK
jgi:hypothetical protein